MGGAGRKGAISILCPGSVKVDPTAFDLGTTTTATGVVLGMVLVQGNTTVDVEGSTGVTARNVQVVDPSDLTMDQSRSTRSTRWT